MTEVVYRKLREEDFDQVLYIWQNAGLPFRPQGRESRGAFSRQLRDDHIIMLGAIVDDKLIGVVIGSHDGRKGWINRLAVVPEWQNKGIAQELVNRVEGFFTAHGIMMFAALINNDNFASMTLFEKLGYEIKEHIMYFRKFADKDY